VSTAIRVRVALAVTVLMWGSAFVAIRVGAQDYDVGPFLLLRFLIPTVVLGLWLARTGQSLLPPRADRGRVVLLGVFFAAYIGLLVAGERTVDGGTASMLAETSPLLTAALAVPLLGERAGRWLVAGLLTGFAGAALIALGEGGGGRLEAGALLILGAALAQALLLVAQKPALERQSAIAVIAQASAVGVVLSLPFTVGLVDAVRHEPAEATLAVIFVAITTGAVSYVTLAYAIARSTSTGQVSSVLYLVPPVAVAISWVYPGETPSGLAIAGGALALAGVAIAQRR
jgi:drug/metabolite transporter (DMT)-like permease